MVVGVCKVQVGWEEQRFKSTIVSHVRIRYESFTLPFL